MSKPRRETYTVTVTRPEGVTKADMKEFIEDAVHSWGAGGNPDDPLFDGHRPVKVASNKPLPEYEHVATVDASGPGPMGLEFFENTEQGTALAHGTRLYRLSEGKRNA